jgi:hypothetical protein
MRKLKNALFIEFFLSVGLALLMFFVVGLQNGMFLFSIPFEWIGTGLRYLSLWSTFGNVIAIFVYIFLSLLPLIYLLRKRKKIGLTKADALLPIISIYSFYMLYEFINPGLMIDRVPEIMADASSLPFVKMTLVIVFYSLCIGYLILRLAGTLSMSNIDNRFSYLCLGLQRILILVSVIYTFFLGYFYIFEALKNLSKYEAENSALINLLFTVVKYILESLPILFTILILIAAVNLLKEMIGNHMQEEEIIAANQMGRISRHTVYITVMSNITINIIQFLLSNQLNDTMYNLELSLFPLIIAFFAMILSGYFKQTKDLHEDNEMII